MALTVIESIGGGGNAPAHATAPFWYAAALSFAIITGATCILVWRVRVRARARKQPFDGQLGFRAAVVLLLANVFIGVLVSEILDVWLRECLYVGGASGVCSAAIAWRGLRRKED